MTSQVGPYRLRVPDDVAVLLRELHPSLKRRIKGALRAVQQDPRSGKPLREEFAGLRSYRVSRFRIVYRIADKTTIEIIAVGPRKHIYEETFRLLRRPHRELFSAGPADHGPRTGKDDNENRRW